ncbi:aldolase/citrate lyase family protein [Rhizobacter sp. LjRoot28]|uniref:aldolase/citrate lyase family protein n=1 Tax=Rhizobacter sp. LjRoot28 TaxID=3342309 RepID=UPI003ECD2BC3
MKFLMITNDPAVAQFAVARGVDRIFVDLEFLGKETRQGHLDTVISRHAPEDIERVRPVVPVGRLLVRVNPMHDGSQAEIDDAISRGADIVMLPMFRAPAEVAAFVSAVGGRARTCLLIETISAVESAPQWSLLPGIDEVHVGLNDLHLELQQRFMFQPLADGAVDPLAVLLRDRGIPFGIGGVARVGEGLLPAELLLAEHVRLGSTGAILSRTFHRQARTVEEIVEQMDFEVEVRRLREAYVLHQGASPRQLATLHTEVQGRVATIVAAIEAKSSHSA